LPALALFHEKRTSLQLPYSLDLLLSACLPFVHPLRHIHGIRAAALLHPLQLAGKNSHHIVEATFKAFARALRHACETDARRAGTVASSKGVLTQQ
jgi:hypothetical protein